MQVKDMFPSRYLRGQDMSKPILVELRSVEKTELRAGPDKPAEPAYLLFFENVSTGKPEPIRGLVHDPRKGHALVLRRELAEQIMYHTATNDTAEWRGKRVVLYPDPRTVARRNIVSICARAQKQGNGSPPEAPPAPLPPAEDEAEDEAGEAN